MKNTGALALLCVLSMILAVVMSDGPLKFIPKSHNKHLNIFEEFSKYELSGKGKTEINQLFKILLGQSRKTKQKMGNLKEFSFKDCGGTVATVKKLSITPDPISIQGSINLTAEVDMKSTVQVPSGDPSTQLNATVTLKKKVEGSYIKIPCIDQIGSCTYNDICQMLDPIPECPMFLVQNKIPCHCPFKAGVYNLPSAVIDLGMVPLPAGDFQIEVVFNYQKKKAACFNATFSIAY